MHYEVYGEMVRNLGSPVYPRALFAAMLDRFGEGADILTVLKDGRPLASALNFYFRGTVMPYWGGGTAASREYSASEMMYYQVMCHAGRRGCSTFNFGRSKVGTGTHAFKENWGFDPNPLTYAVRTADGAAPRSVNPLDPKYRLQVALWKKLPLPLANRIGPHIARGLG
jgi:FemAB-related protein (PEP-CTERM system-associated)